MSKRYIYGIIAAVVLIIAAVLISTVSSRNKTPVISLPSPPANGNSSELGSDENSLDVTAETVCSALKILNRTENYSRTYTVKTLWEGGESEESISVWQKGDKVRMTISGKNKTKNLLILGDELYIWYDNSVGFLKTTLDKEGYSSADSFARLITYEELFDTAPEDITDAGYVDKLNQPCIFAEYISDGDYVNRIYVSVDTGLLVASEKLKNGKEVITMATTSTELITPADSVFAVPAT